MNDIKQGDIWYFDTNVLHGLGAKTLDKLLLFCQQNSEKTFYISEIVVWECAWNFKKDRDKNDRFSDTSSLAKFLAAYKSRLQKHNFTIISINQDIYDKGNAFINDPNLFFGKKEAGNDKRDAYICATALLARPNHFKIFVDEKKVQKFFKNSFEIKSKDDLIDILNTAFGQDDLEPIKNPLDNIYDKEIFETFTEFAHKIFYEYDNDRYAIYKPQWEQAEKNLRLQEQEKNRSFQQPESIKSNRYELSKLIFDNGNILERVLGYIGFFDTIEKQKLFIFLQSYGYADSKINTQIQNAISEHFVIETDNYFIANNNNIESKTILNQAMDSIMPELLEKLDLA